MSPNFLPGRAPGLSPGHPDDYLLGFARHTSQIGGIDFSRFGIHFESADDVQRSLLVEELATSLNIYPMVAHIDRDTPGHDFTISGFRQDDFQTFGTARVGDASTADWANLDRSFGTAPQVDNDQRPHYSWILNGPQPPGSDHTGGPSDLLGKNSPPSAQGQSSGEAQSNRAMSDSSKGTTSSTVASTNGHGELPTACITDALSIATDYFWGRLLDSDEIRVPADSETLKRGPFVFENSPPRWLRQRKRRRVGLATRNQHDDGEERATGSVDSTTRHSEMSGPLSKSSNPSATSVHHHEQNQAGHGGYVLLVREARTVSTPEAVAVLYDSIYPTQRQKAILWLDSSIAVKWSSPNADKGGLSVLHTMVGQRQWSELLRRVSELTDTEQPRKPKSGECFFKPAEWTDFKEICVDMK